MPAATMVFLIEDDERVRRPLRLLLNSAGHKTEEFSDAESFLSQYEGQPGCIVLDVRLDGAMNGLDLQDELLERGITIPVIFISGYADVPMAVSAMRRGARDFFEKPFDDQALLNRVQAAIRSDLITYEHRNLLMRDLSRLTAREREVMQLLARARDTKQIARELDISPKTAEKHRANVLVKMNVDTVVELVCRLRPTDETFVGALLADSSQRMHNGHAL